tara:strand:+ start:3706 stop:3927 length:222 start_codon:yes stop_codon:yes gene_type:complete
MNDEDLTEEVMSAVDSLAVEDIEELIVEHEVKLTCLCKMLEIKLTINDEEPKEKSLVFVEDDTASIIPINLQN